VACLYHIIYTLLHSCGLSITDEMYCTVHVQLWFVHHWLNALYCTCTAVVCLSLMKCTVLYMYSWGFPSLIKCTVLYMYSCGLSITDEMHCTVHVQLWFVYHWWNALYSCGLSITDEMHCTVHVQLWFDYHGWNALYCTCTAVVCLSRMKCTVL
jgi:hypothetical protein